MKIGLDIGSTTIKAVVLDEAGEIVFRRYERHRAQIALLSEVLLHAIMVRFPGERFQLGISGSAGASGFVPTSATADGFSVRGVGEGMSRLICRG